MAPTQSRQHGQTQPHLPSTRKCSLPACRPKRWRANIARRHRPVTTFRNAISRSKTAKRNYVADQLESECDDFGGLTFRVPFDHGILNNWDVQKTVWDRVYGDKGKGLAVSGRGRVWRQISTN